ncbi:MAG: 50S ribosomal protein L4 [Armatimonadota bacterium]
MATVPVYTPAGKEAGTIELADDVFAIEPNIALVHQAIVTTLANMRQGSADTKTRGEVHHSTRKMWRQKGTGRARQGMRSAPHWKGGGVVFGPHPRDFSQSFPKKMRRKALLSALSARLTDGAFLVIEDYGFDQPKTKQASALLAAFGVMQKKVLVVLDDPNNATVVLAFRNLPNVKITSAEMLGTYDLLDADHILFTRASITHLQELKQQPIGIARWMAKGQEGGAA